MHTYVNTTTIATAQLRPGVALTLTTAVLAHGLSYLMFVEMLWGEIFVMHAGVLPSD
jgi:hypothetical protein